MYDSHDCTGLYHDCYNMSDITVHFRIFSGTAGFLGDFEVGKMANFIHFERTLWKFLKLSQLQVYNQAYLEWYSTLPLCVSEFSMEPLDFGETLKLKKKCPIYILRELCGSF